MTKIFTTRVKTNLNGVLQMTQMVNGIMMTGDNAANQIVVELYNDFDKIIIPNDTRIVGYFIRSDGNTIEVDGSVNEEGEAVVIIPETAYQVSGSMSIAVRLFEDPEEMTYKGYYKIVIRRGYFDSETSQFVEVTDEEQTEGPHGEAVEDHIFTSTEFVQVTDLGQETGPNGEPIVTRTFSSWGTKIVIATLTCYVRITESDSLIDEYHHIPDVQELLSYLERLDGWRQQVILEEAGRVEAEEARVEAETTRQTNYNTKMNEFDAAEAQRQSDYDHKMSDFDDAEAQRQSDYDTKMGQFDAAETARQNAFNTAQTQRQTDYETRASGFDAAEAQRQSNYDTKMGQFDAAEAQRQSDYETRAAGYDTAETQRQSTFETNEQARQDEYDDLVDAIDNTERLIYQAEQTRSAAESARQTNESTRQSNESTRQSNEATRQSQETAREQAQALRNAKIDNMTVDAIGLDPYDAPTATITEVDGHKHIVFGLRPGDPFVIAKTFESIAAMNAYTGTDIRVGQFVLITSNVEDPDNARMYVKTSDSYNYVTDLSGSQGIRGERGYTGNGISQTEITEDYKLRITYTNGDVWTSTNSIRGLTGETGNGIALIEFNNANYTMTITMTDGTSYTSGSLRGEAGRSVTGAELTADNKLKITFSDGAPFTTDIPVVGRSVTGAELTSDNKLKVTFSTGDPFITPISVVGEDGRGITNVSLTADNKLQIEFDTGDPFVTPMSVVGPKGDPGAAGTNFIYDSTEKSLVVEYY